MHKKEKMTSETFLQISSSLEDDIFNLSLATWVVALEDNNYTEKYKGVEMEIRHIIYEFLKLRRVNLYIINSDFKNHVFRKGHPVYIKFQIMANLERKIPQSDFSLLISQIEHHLSSLNDLSYHIKRPKKMI